MRDYQPLPFTWFMPLAGLLGGLMAAALVPILGAWSVVPALAFGVVIEHTLAFFLSGGTTDWRNALLGGLSAAVGGAVAVAIILGLEA